STRLKSPLISGISRGLQGYFAGSAVFGAGVTDCSPWAHGWYRFPAWDVVVICQPALMFFSATTTKGPPPRGGPFASGISIGAVGPRPRNVSVLAVVDLVAGAEEAVVEV